MIVAALILYARREPTLDPDAKLPHLQDVQAYYDPHCKLPAARWLWSAAGRPHRRRQKSVVFKGATYELKWL